MSQFGRALICLLLLVAVVFAGCSSSSDTNSGTGASSTSSGQKSTSGGPKGSGTQTVTGGASGGAGGSGGPGGSGGSGSNHAPSGAISASISSGGVPLTVKFDLTGTDQDGDKLSWNLDYTGDGKTDKSGTTLPASESYNYTTAGSYNVTYSITDSKDTTTYKVTINATASGSDNAVIQVISGSYAVGSPGLCAIATGGTGGSLGAEAGVTYIKADLVPEALEHNFKAVYTLTGSAATLLVAFPDGKGNFASPATVSGAGPTELTGVISSGAASVEISSCAGAGVTVTLTVTR